MSNGDLTPCSLLPNIVICNVENLNYKEIVEKYKNSKLIKHFIEKIFLENVENAILNFNVVVAELEH